MLTVPARAAIFGLVLALALAGAASAQQPAAKLDRPTRLDQLHQALHLTADQEPAWRAYASAQSDSAAASRREATRALLSTLPTPRRLALIDAALSQDLQDFRRQSAVVTAFYVKLAPDQQKVFDRETAPPTPGVR